MTNPMKGFLAPGPNGPRMTEGQLCIVTRGALEAYRAAGRVLNPGALDSYPADKSCWTCAHHVHDPLQFDPGDDVCRKLDKDIPSKHMEGGNAGCPHFADPAAAFVNMDSEPR